jgi:hypothetical protein
VPDRFEHDNHYPANIFLVVNDQYSHRATCLLRLHGSHDNGLARKSEQVSSTEYPAGAP